MYLKLDSGKLNATISAAVSRAREEMERALLTEVRDVAAEAKAAWPVDRTMPHSKDRFRTFNRSTDTRIRIQITNAAPYARYIYRPGSKRSRLVWMEEIKFKLDKRIPKVIRKTQKAVRGAFNARGR